MTLAAKITLDDSSYQKGIGNAEKAGSGLAQKMSSMTVAVGQLAADMIKTGFNAVKNVMGGAIDSYADYQQLIGGVETLFKGSADRVANYAKQSYKTTGLSANEYMETVTSFSASLLKGLKCDTEAAADLANVAVTDMADNANKMGTDISSIQAAYMGFAKQNYTMLDNLKLGYGGTASEMVRLINDSGTLNKKIKNLDGITFDQIVAAIHAIQTEMGVTGTTAQEAAKTISGSKASMAAAWEDLLSAIGGEGGEDRMQETLKNFEESFSTYMENFIPTLADTIANSGTLVEAIANGIASLPTTLMADLGKNAVEAGADMVTGLGTITQWALESIVNVFKTASLDNTAITDLGYAIGDLLGSAVGTIVTNTGAIFEGILAIGTGLAGGLVQGLVEGLTGEDSEVSKITDALNNAIQETDTSSTQATALVSYLKSLQEQFGNAASNTGAWQQAMETLEGVLPNASEAISGYAEDISGALSTLSTADDALKALEGLKKKYGKGAEKTKEWKQAIGELEKVLPKSKEAIEQYQGDVEKSLETITKSQELIQQLKDIAALYGQGATETDAWKDAVAELDKILPNAGETFSKYGANVQGAIDKLDELIKKQRETQIMNALNAASGEQLALLTQQTLARNTAQNTYDRNAAMQQSYLENIRTAIMDAAKVQAETYKEQATEFFGGFDENDPRYTGLMNLAQGLYDTGGIGENLQSIADLDFSGLQAIVNSLADYDNSSLMEIFGTNQELYNNAQAAMETAQGDINRLNGEIQATQQAISDTNAAIAQTAQELLGSGTDASTAIKTGGAVAEAALEAFAAHVRSIKITTGKFNYIPEATGIEEVPYTGFRAELHKGEAILTAKENAQRKAGTGSAEMVSAVQRMRKDLQNIQLVVGEETFGKAVVSYGGSRMDNYIGEAQHRELTGYGW